MSFFKYNDINLFYEVKGNPNSKKVVAFFNGVMASTSSWGLLYPIFEKMGYKIILHDFKGQLKSDKPKGPYTFEEHVLEAKALFDFLGVKKVNIVGTSYGGEIGMKFAYMFPKMTNSLTLIDSVSELNEIVKGFVLGWKVFCDTNDGETFFWSMAPSIYGPKFLEKNKEMLAERAKAIKSNPNNYLEGQKILYDTFNNECYLTDILHEIKCPTLIICGANDILKPPMFSKIIYDNIPDAEYILLPECGHVSIFEKPKELESVISGFIQKHI